MKLKLWLLPAACWLLATLSAFPADKTGTEALTTLKRSNDRLVRFTLDNGMTCLLKEDHAAPVVSIQVWVNSGSIHEGNLLGGGLSHYVEHMVFKGTPTRKPGDIGKTIIGLGGELNAYTSFDRTVFFTDVPSRNWKTALDTYADALINAAFPDTEWQREKEVILSEFRMRDDNPETRLQDLFFSTAFSTHPIRQPVIGIRDIFTSITREDLMEYYHRRYIPDNMVAVVAGDIQVTDARQALTRAFSGFKRKPNPPVFIPAEPRQLGPRLVRQSGSYSVSRLVVAFHTVALSDKDAPTLDLLARLAGGSQSSRIVQDIKETRKLVHNIEADSFALRDAGLFSISANLDPAQETPVQKAILDAIASLSKTPFSRAEIEKARRLMLVDKLAALQTVHGQAASYAEGEMFLQNPRAAETYLERLQAVTPEDLQEVSRKYFREDNRTIVILGPDTTPTSGPLPAAMSQPSDVTRRKLACGVPLLLREDHRLPFVYMCAAFAGGVISEDENTSGISQMVSELVTRGTPDRTAVSIAESLEKLGADLSPFAGFNSFGVRGQCLAGDANTLMEVMFDCLGNAAFPTNEVDKQRTIQLAAIESEHEKPMNIARDTLNDIIFAGHPYRFNMLGRRESVSRLDQAALRDYYHRQAVTGNMTLSIFGDITTKEAEALAEKYIRRIRNDRAPARLSFSPKPVLPSRVEKREPREQCIVLYGVPGVGLTDPRRDALSVLEAAMGGMSSRLFETVRDQRGLAYYASTRQRIGLDAGLFMLFAGTRSDTLPEVERLFREEIDRVTTRGLDPEEIARARNILIGGQELQLEDNAGLAMNCAVNELTGLGYDFDFTTRQRIEAVTPEQIRLAAASILDTNKLAISVVLPEKK